MVIALTIIAVLVYEFIGLVTAVGFYQGDDDLLLVCLLVWPLVYFVHIATWIGLKIKSKLERK